MLHSVFSLVAAETNQTASSLHYGYISCGFNGKTKHDLIEMAQIESVGSFKADETINKDVEKPPVPHRLKNKLANSRHLHSLSMYGSAWFNGSGPR